MDIFIKSFNRPYYLDRCLFSIYKFVINTNNKIIVLDDGTPQKYLNKIQEKYQDIVIVKSDYYDEKSTNIQNKETLTNKKIPIDFWIKSIENASNYFVLLEDDIWFTKPIDLNKLESTFTNDKIQLLKLFWLGNNNLLSDKIVSRNDLYTIYKPQLYVKNVFLYQILFQFYRFKARKIFSFLNFYTINRELNYYSIYGVAGVVFKKEYFLSLWKNHTNSVNEQLQLRNALRFLVKNKLSNFGNTNNEIVKTGFMSSATNQNKEYKDIFVDMFVFNSILNESWFANNFETINNLEQDIKSAQIELILDIKNHPNSQKNSWLQWVIQFKKQYADMGCNLD